MALFKVNRCLHINKDGLTWSDLLRSTCLPKFGKVLFMSSLQPPVLLG